MDKPKIKLKRKRKFHPKNLLQIFWRHKKIILSVFAVFLVAFGVLYWENWADAEYQKQYVKHFSDAKATLRNAISEGKSQKNIEKISTLESVQNRISGEKNSYCNVHSQVKWQNFFSGFRKKVEACEMQNNKLSELLLSIKNLVSYLRFQESLIGIISSANTQTNQSVQDQKFESIEQYWRKASTDITNLSDSDQLGSVSVKYMDEMAEAWKNVNNANVAKDQQAFEKARDDLDVAYSNLSKITDASITQTKNITDAVKEKYSAM